MLAIIILVVIIGIAGAIYVGMRFSAAAAEKKNIAEAKKRKKETEERKKQEKKHMELQMHQEEVITMAKNDPEIVARVVKNWLT